MKTDRLIEEIKKDEGLRLQMYDDSVGVPTIGYGHNLQKGIPQEVADLMLKIDLKEAIDDLWRNQPEIMEKLNSARQEVLINMCFNLGIGRLMMFKKMWSALEGLAYGEAAMEMLDSRWADQVGIRAQKLSKVMEDGSW